MLSEREQELIAVSASIAAGCQPCTAYHFRAARIAGAGDDEIRQAVNDALGVRRSATEVMARIARDRLGEASEPDATSAEKGSLISELASISAAYAINCVTNLRRHSIAARQHGATDEQILTAIKIACAVKSMAGKKVEEAAAKEMGATEDRDDACGCHGDDDGHGKVAKAAATLSTEQTDSSSNDCGCRK